VQRICFQLQVNPDTMDDYVARHADVWPEMRDALIAAGWRNYSLFVSGNGTLTGYLECEDFAAAKAAMEATEVNSRWQAEMAPLFAGLNGARPDEQMLPLAEIFHLD